MTAAITIALPKGRVLRAVAPLLARAGVDATVLLADDRTLVREDASSAVRFILLKPDDVPTYVEYGAADLGVCGRDVLIERPCDVYQPLDLRVGRCRMVVAGVVGRSPPTGVPRVATKYPRCTSEHFARRGVQAEIVSVQGSVELAPIVGLSDLIVDLVETGATLAQNGLEEREQVARISSLLVANRAAYKLRQARIRPLVEALRAAVEAQGG
ncbi:MAG TPA: ATP phosphoribosyltransferase [Polyangiaceae bacterium]|nr:ATP phosphoribosyltransferase [Polyangiaceae bacterium]